MGFNRKAWMDLHGEEPTTSFLEEITRPVDTTHGWICRRCGHFNRNTIFGIPYRCSCGAASTKDAALDDVYCPEGQTEPTGWQCVCGSFQPDDEAGTIPECNCCNHTHDSGCAQDHVQANQIHFIN